MIEQTLTLRKIRAVMGLAITGMIITIIISFPIVTHVNVLARWAGTGSMLGDIFPTVGAWVDHVQAGVSQTNLTYPFLFYMSDWLVFAHVVIAIFFIGAYRDPVRNIWIIEASMMACVLVIFVAAIAGDVRGIPIFWRVADASFGIVCFFPLWFARKWTKQLEMV